MRRYRFAFRRVKLGISSPVGPKSETHYFGFRCRCHAAPETPTPALDTENRRARLGPNARLRQRRVEFADNFRHRINGSSQGLSPYTFNSKLKTSPESETHHVILGPTVEKGISSVALPLVNGATKNKKYKVRQKIENHKARECDYWDTDLISPTSDLVFGEEMEVQLLPRSCFSSIVGRKVGLKVKVGLFQLVLA